MTRSQLLDEIMETAAEKAEVESRLSFLEGKLDDGDYEEEDE
jgi:hypothetical protein